MKYYNIEFLRFFFSVLIVYFHILYSNIMKYVDGIGAYMILRQSAVNLGLIVECFFILAGFFLYPSTKNVSLGFCNFAVKKFFRLWPVFAFAMLPPLLFHSHSLNMLDFFFLRATGLSLDFRGINWYISPLFWILLFYFCLIYYWKDEEKKNLFIAVLVYFAYMLNISVLNGNFSRATVYGFISLGICRAIAGIGLGYLLAYLSNYLENIHITTSFGKSKFMFPILINAIEIIFFTNLLSFLLGFTDYKNKFAIVVLFSINLLCFVKQRGLLSKLLNRPVFAFWGKFSYSIYVMQQISFNILSRSLWQTSLIQNPYLCLTLSVCLSVVIGIGTYYLIERPCMNFYKSLTFSEKKA